MTSSDRTPWQEDKVWSEMELSLNTAVKKSRVLDNDYVINIVNTISFEYRRIDTLMDDLCRETCQSCQDVCCRHATVWYDFRDLLYFTLRFKQTPDRQIDKSPDGRCMQLGEKGCMLSRPERPFICTWYICTPQKSILTEMGGGRREELDSSLEKIKGLRKELETAFCKMSAGRLT